MDEAALVDIHCHGGGGHGFGESLDTTLAALAAHREAGTDAVVASLTTAPLDRMVARMDVLREAMAHDEMLLGVHLEGPFLAPSRRGAHPAGALRTPTPALVDRLLGAGEDILRQVTIAPELPGGLRAIEQLAGAGVVVAVGHTEATATESRDAFAAGATLLTHAFNAMPPIAGRSPGPVAAALANDRVFLEVIADGVHVAPEALRLLFAAAPDRVVLVSDAIPGALAGDGRSRLGELDVVVADGRATVAGTDTLAGSTLALSGAIEVATAAGVARELAVHAATNAPLLAMGVNGTR